MRTPQLSMVLSLVVMEYTQWEDADLSEFFKRFKVLILVVMEYTQWDRELEMVIANGGS